MGCHVNRCASAKLRGLTAEAPAGVSWFLFAGKCAGNQLTKVETIKEALETSPWKKQWYFHSHTRETSLCLFMILCPTGR